MTRGLKYFSTVEDITASEQDYGPREHLPHLEEAANTRLVLMNFNF